METFTTDEKIEYIDITMKIVMMLRWYAAMDDIDGQRRVLSILSLVTANYYAKLGDAKEGKRMLFYETFVRSPEYSSDDSVRRITEQVLAHADRCGL